MTADPSFFVEARAGALLDAAVTTVFCCGLDAAIVGDALWLQLASRERVHRDRGTHAGIG